MSSLQKHDEVLEQFVSILKTEPKRSCLIYNKSKNIREANTSISDVITNVTSTIKALNDADEIRFKKKNVVTRNKYKMKHFVPACSLNNLSKVRVVLLKKKSCKLQIRLMNKVTK